jgi:outer membrane receptor for ferrienterochelin and colicins
MDWQVINGFQTLCNKYNKNHANPSTIRSSFLSCAITARIMDVGLAMLKRMQFFSKRAPQSVLALMLVMFPLSLQAQITSGDDSTIIYPAEYFTEYAPITAQDMLDRIPGQGAGGSPSRGGPGVPGNPSSGGRGLGSGDGGVEILVDGKRTAGKNNESSGQLSRISAGQVREIQIIRGTSGELDVRGSGQVVNVILYEALSANSIAFDTTISHAHDDETTVGASVSFSGQSGNLNYLISAIANPRYFNQVSTEKSTLGDFTPNDNVLEKRRSESDNNSLTMNLGYTISDNSSVRFNALYGVNDGPTDVNRYTTDWLNMPGALTIEREAIPGEKDNWEIGGDYEYTFEGGDRFKLLAIANQNNNAFQRERFLMQPDTTELKNLFIGSDSVTEEKIIRGSYTMDIFEGQDIEFGIERAQTTLDSKLALGLDIPGGTISDAVGGLVPQTLSNANSTVEEIRYEPFLIHNWNINSRMTLESTLVYETSEISQSGDVSNKRDFDFVKPKVDFRYDLTPSLQLRGSIERIVNQLSFSDFVAANDEQDNDATTQAGNASLRQQTQWKYAFNAEYRLPQDVGVLSAEIFYADHQDVIDRMDVSTSEDNLQSANGNIGDGEELVANLSASVRMGMIGLPNLLVTTTLNVQDSEVKDPFLGIDRRFQLYQRGRTTIMFRHDIPSWRANWGMQLFDRIDGGMFRYDVDDIEFAVGEPRLNLFAEYIDSRGLTYRLDAGALTDGSQRRRRTRFIGRVSDNILEEYEYRKSVTGMELSFKISGTF